MKKVVTHNGTFHADDVFAVATLALRFGIDSLEIKRTRDESEFESADMILDVGGKTDDVKFFDHHQKEGVGLRQNGIPFASFGLIWKTYGTEVCGDAFVAAEIDRNLVQIIDAGDNGVAISAPLREGVREFGIAGVIAHMNPTALEDVDIDKKFLGAVLFAQEIIKREIAYAKVLIEAERKCDEVYQNTNDKRVLTFNCNLDWKGFTMSPQSEQFKEVLFLVYPSEDNWVVRALRRDIRGFESKQLLPGAWAGLSGKALEDVSGVIGAKFCHRALFLATAVDKESALLLAQKALV